MSFDKGRDRAEDLRVEERAKELAGAMTTEQIEMKRLELMERQLALQEAQAATMATHVERTAPRENPNYVAHGPFTNPETGEPWAKDLKVEMFQNSLHLNKGGTLTREEVTQLNRLQPLERGIITKSDRSQVLAKVTPTYDAQMRLNKLVISHPMGRDDNAQAYPPLDELAKQLADQAEAVPA